MKICLNYQNAYLEQQLDELVQDDPNIIIEKSSDLTDVDVLITSSITEEALKKASQLKVIFFPYTGVNHLPLKMIQEKGITIVNSHAHAPIVALRAVSLGLALLGRVVELHNHLTKGVWKGFNESATWTSIINKRVGVIGMGDIGQNIVNYLKPYQVQYETLKRYEKKCGAITPIKYHENIAEVCENSDIIFISLPLTKETKDIIDHKILTKMYDKFIVNVGRGALINEEDLYQALKNNTLKGAALDVWYQYPQGEKATAPSKYPIHQLDNVVLSPHCAGNAFSTKKVVVDEMIKQIKHYLDTNQAKNNVDLKKEY